MSALLDTDAAGTLFHRAIIQSGAANIIMTQNTSLERQQLGVKALMQVTGCTTVQQLAALTEQQYIEANETEVDEDGNTPGDYTPAPICGASPLHDDPYEALHSGNAKDVDVLIGTNLDEINYWINEMSDKPFAEMSEEERQETLGIYSDWYVALNYQNLMSKLAGDEQANVLKYLSLYSDREDYQAKSRLLSDVFYRQPSIYMAEKHAGAGSGKTYMYLFEKKQGGFDFIGAAHAMELPYVFLNTNDVKTYGEIDMNLAHNICDAWVNFARTGNPSTSAAVWPEYDEQNRQTMIFGNDCSVKAVSDPYSTERGLLQFAKKYHLTQSIGS